MACLRSTSEWPRDSNRRLLLQLPQLCSPPTVARSNPVSDSAARAFGIKRGMRVEEARSRCPGLHTPHVPVISDGGSTTPAANASANAPASGRKPSGTKVSLERYRIESQRIFAVLEQLAPVRVMRFQPARLLPQLPLLCSHRLCSLLSSRTLEYRNSRRCSSGLASTKRTWT